MEASLAILLVIVAATAAAVVAIGRRRRRLGRTALGALAGTVAVWLTGIALMLTGWKDVDGWIDCNQACHGWHEFGAILFWGPPLLAVVLVVVAIAAALARRPSD